MKRKISLCLASALLAATLLGCSSKGSEGADAYTYNSYTPALATNWNPHTWEMNADKEILEYILAPLAEMTVKDSKTGEYQWIFVAAEDIRDVTASRQEDLRKYPVSLPEGKTPEDITEGYVFEIALRPEMKWENGDLITADDYIYSMQQLLDPKMQNYRANTYWSGDVALAGASRYHQAQGSWDGVGLYKVDDYIIRYVCQTACDYYDLLTSMTSNWLVHKQTYEKLKDPSGAFVTTAYNTSRENTMSCGPYRMESMQDDKQMVLVRNEHYWEYTKDAGGKLTSTTFFTVDGEHRPQFQTERIVIDVLTDDAAKLAFLSGKLDTWTPAADEVVEYATSPQLYQADETYTMRFFFHTRLSTLQKLDQGNNRNSVVLSSDDFRKAMSLALDRQEWVTATAGYKPAYSMISSLYYYDVYEDPASIYRNTREAMEAICRVYGVKWGEGTPYATLQEAYRSINGFNLTQARELFTKACRQLAADGLYTPGEEIVIEIAYAAGTLDSSQQQQLALFNRQLNRALEGTGFGKLELRAVDELANRYQAVAQGQYAMGYGAWGGAAFYPFQVFRVYCDPAYADPIHEIGCWDPTKETLTLTVGQEQVTMTWQDWSNSMTGTGAFANAENSVKLQILAALEEQYLQKYYVIPLATTTSCNLLSYKVSYYTDQYSVMYGFGGMRLLQHHYTDGQWAAYVSSQNGRLAY